MNSGGKRVMPADPDGGARPHPDTDDDVHALSESTPLLPSDNEIETQRPLRTRHSSAASLLRSFQSKSSDPRRWPSIIALFVLCFLVIAIICFGFVAPSTIEEYANDAVTFEPTALAIESFTMRGVRARVRGDVKVDARRVSDKHVRRFGRFATWVARQVETGRSEVEVTLPEYSNVVLGTAIIPPIKIDVRNGHATTVDFVTELRPGQLESIKRIANDWLRGRLGELEVIGKAKVPIKSGIFRFGTRELAQKLVFAGKDVAIPAYDIRKLDIHDLGQKIAADVKLEVENHYPVDFTLPSLDFVVSVEGCPGLRSRIALANATTAKTKIIGGEPIELDVVGVVQHLSDELKEPCPDVSDSPLDFLVAKYIRGEEMTLYVQGSDRDNEETPKWLADIISTVIVPVPFRKHALGKLIRDFSLSNVDLGLPDPFAEPGSAGGRPTISAVVDALINIPSEINFDLDVRRIRADADVFYHDEKLGSLDLSHWQQANSTRLEATGKNVAGLLIRSEIQKAPLNITDEDVFASVFQALLFGGEEVTLEVEAKVDVAVKTALGEFIVRRVPAAGSIPIKPIGQNTTMESVDLKVDDLRILGTSSRSLTLSALVNFTNPTNYSASVPYFDVLISHNGSSLGTATAESLVVKPGLNTNVHVTATWDPRAHGGQDSHETGLDLLSRYISGEKTTISVSMHEMSIPSQPSLGRALSNLSLEVPAPRLWTGDEGGGGEGAGQFIQDATMHLVTSTAVFVLVSPLKHTELFITYINATALYQGSKPGDEAEPVGNIIDYDVPFAVAPDRVPVTSPRLPVDWSLGSVGYEAVRGALGGSLKLACEALVGIRIGKWEERIKFRGRGIGAKVRL